MSTLDCIVQIDQQLDIFAFDVGQGTSYFDAKGAIQVSGTRRVYLPVYEVPVGAVLDDEMGRLLYATAVRVEETFETFSKIVENLPKEWEGKYFRYRRPQVPQLKEDEILLVNGDADFVGVLIRVSNIPRGIAAFVIPEGLRIYRITGDEREARLNRQVL